MRRIIKAALPHMVIIMAMMFIIFLVLDRYNPTMGFVTSAISRWLLLAFCISAAALGITASHDNRARAAAKSAPCVKTN